MKEATLQAKQAVVQEIKDAFENAKSVVIVDYRGLNVADVTELRNQFRQNGVTYKVYKNTMVNLAMKDLGYTGYEEYLTGPNGFVFSNEDMAKGPKIAHDFAQDHKELEIKAGLLDGDLLSIEQVESLAKLPPKEVLIAQVLGGFQAPISGFANVLQGTIRNLVYALNAIAEKEGEAA